MTGFDTSHDLGYDTSQEDASTVSWVDQTIAEAEQGGFLDQLAQHVDADPLADPNAYAAAVERARAEGAFANDQPDFVPPVAANRDAIREAIFAKLRRPDGTPFAAGYVSGPAARKAMYDGEDVRNGVWRSGEANADLDTRTTKYENRDFIEHRASGVDEDGRIVDSMGFPVHGKWGWVIDDQTGGLMLFDLNEQEWYAPDGSYYQRQDGESMWDLLKAGFRMRATHHTTPVAGMPVTGAGIIELDTGTITQLTDESGHYRPDARQQYDAVEALGAQGANLDEASIRLTGREMTGRPTDKAGWIDAAAAQNNEFPTGDVDLTSQQFRQTGGDEYQIRLKQALNDEIENFSWPQADDSSTDDDSAEVSRELVTMRDGSTQVKITYANGQYSLFDPNDAPPAAPQDDNPVVRIDYERANDGSWQRRRTRADGNYALDPVDEAEVPAEYRTPADPPAQDEEHVQSFSETEEEHVQSFSETEEQHVQSFSETEAPAEPSSESSESESEDVEGDDAAEDDDLNADFLRQARTYLSTAGHRATADWMRTLPQHAQDTLLADPEFAAAWRQEDAQPAAPAWQPQENDWAAAATANAASVDALDDRGMANFTLAGFSLLIGGGHDAQHASFVANAGDVVTGSVTVRKAAIGRGAGSLTFTGVPPAKQDVVRAAVARFSRKEVRFG